MPETETSHSGNTSRLSAVLSHWLWVIPVLLIVTALTLRQIDCYPPSTDEFFSLYNTGWLVYGPYSPIDVIESLYTYSSDHTPGYFILLSVWGNLTSYELASGRVFSIFSGLLALAVAYRLARDFIAPEAAFFALIILASNTFYNFYYAHIRMYTLFVLMAGIVLWLYLRCLQRNRRRRRRDFFALGASSLFFLSIHLFSIVFMLSLALYHILFAPKSRRWLAVTLTGAATSILSAPWILVIISRTLIEASEDLAVSAGEIWSVLSALLAMISNGQPLLLVVVAAGLCLAAIRGRMLPRSILLIGGAQVLLIFVMSAAAPQILTTNSGYRYLSPVILVITLVVATALYSLYSYQSMLALLLALWLVAGIHFQATATWQQFIGGLDKVYRMPPWQVISRLASSSPTPLIIAFNLELEKKAFSWNRRIPYSQRLHFLGRQAIEASSALDLPTTETLVANKSISQGRIWILYDRRTMVIDDYDGLLSVMNGFDYDLCERIDTGPYWAVLDFYWDNLDCGDLELISEPRTAITEHKFYNARLSQDGSQLYFVDSWSAPADFQREHFAMSYQLLSEGWDNVAQLDLPMAHEGQPRRFSMGTSELPPSAYRLMLIVYDTRTGEPLDWIDNPGYVPSMIELSEIAIPG